MRVEEALRHSIFIPLEQGLRQTCHKQRCGQKHSIFIPLEQGLRLSVLFGVYLVPYSIFIPLEQGLRLRRPILAPP